MNNMSLVCFRNSLACLLLVAPLAASANEMIPLSVESSYTQTSPEDETDHQIVVQLSEIGRKSFSEITDKNLRKCLAVWLGEKVVSIPARVLTPLVGGMIIFYPAPPDHAEQISQAIRLQPASLKVSFSMC